MKREVVDSRPPSIVCATREGWRSRGHEVDVPASPGGSIVPLLVDGPSEFREKPAPGHASAVQVCNPNLNVMHTNCHIAIVPRASRVFFPQGNGLRTCFSRGYDGRSHPPIATSEFSTEQVVQ